MKQLLMATTVVLLAFPLAAQRLPQPAENMFPGEKREPMRVQATASSPKLGEWLERLQSVVGSDEKSAHSVRPNVSTEQEEFAFIFPVVGSLPGGNGAYFRSEAFIVNYSPYPQNMAVLWTPAGQYNCEDDAIYIQVPANSWYFYPDFVQSVIKTNGIGAAIVLAVTSDLSAVDSEAVIDGYSRIWTPAPAGYQGTMSQAFPPVSLKTHGSWSVAYGLRNDPQFRTNVGVLNAAMTNRTFQVLMQGANVQQQFSFDVPGCSFMSLAAPRGNFGAMAMYVWANDEQGEWYGYASSVDNASGDNWSSTFR